MDKWENYSEFIQLYWQFTQILFTFHMRRVVADEDNVTIYILGMHY